MLAVLIALTREEKIRPRSGRAGPSFSVRPEKEAKGAVLHGTSAAARWSHEPTCSAGRTKTRRLTALRQFVRPFFHRARRDEKIPSRATQLAKRYAASAFRKLLGPQAVGSASDLCGTIFFTQEPVAYPVNRTTMHFSRLASVSVAADGRPRQHSTRLLRGS